MNDCSAPDAGAPVWVRVGTTLAGHNPILKAGTVLTANKRLVQVRVDHHTLTVPRNLVKAA